MKYGGFVKKIKNVLCICMLIILLPILFISIVILINSYTNPEEIPSFYGWKPFIVLSGSMETQIKSGDIVVVQETDTKLLKVNDIIAFREDDIVITHRIVDIININGDIRYVTKGDNNNQNDDNYVNPVQIEGLYKFRIGLLGNFAMFLQTPIGLVVCLSIPIIILILVQATDSKDKNKMIEEAKKKEDELKKEIERLKRKK